jgi:hypothetical protein
VGEEGDESDYIENISAGKAAIEQLCPVVKNELHTAFIVNDLRS